MPVIPDAGAEVATMVPDPEVVSDPPVPTTRAVAFVPAVMAENEGVAAGQFSPLTRHTAVPFIVVPAKKLLATVVPVMEVGVIAPSVSVIAGVVVGFDTTPEIPLAVTTETVLTDPTAIVHGEPNAQTVPLTVVELLAS